MKRRFVSVVLFALLASLACSGCGGDDDTSSSTTAADVDAAQDTAVGTGDVTADSSSGASDAPTGDAVGCPGGAGCPCSGNADCDQSICLETASGATCAAPCTDASSCSKDEVCASIPGAGGDSASVCVQVAAHLCDPCKSNAACSAPGAEGATCVKRGAEGNFCGVACGAGKSDCPSGTACVDAVDVDGGTSKQCMPAEGATCSCSPLAISKELTTTCVVSGDGGAGCPGVRACLADGKEGAPAGGGLSICMGGSPSSESCNGLDDDCDSETDEGATCDDNDACTTDACTAGTCVHTKTTAACDDGDACTEADSCATGTCVGTAKVCDDKDSCTTDACEPSKGCTHAATNEGGVCDDGDACSSGDTCTAGACTGTNKDCDDGNTCTTDTCDAATGTCASKPKTGSCDDGDPCTEGDACAADAGSGQISCVGGKAKKCDDSNPCTVDSCVKSTGCTSVVDTKVTQPCYTADPTTKGVGICKPGVQACQATGGFGSCVGEVGPAAKELCNNKDDTCNGKVDDACVGGGPPQLAWRLGTVVVQGAGKSLSARMFVGGGAAAGSMKSSSKLSLDLGFYAWLSAWLK